MEVLTGIITDAEIATNTEVVIDSKLPETDVEVSKSITAEVAPQNYVLSSGGESGASGMLAAIPSWIQSAINQSLLDGGSLLDAFKAIRDLMAEVERGVHQRISQVENDYVSTSSLTTTLNSRLDGNYATILDMAQTYVTPDSAQAIAVEAMESAFYDPILGQMTARAFIGNIAHSYVDENSAIAQDVSLLQADLNGITASITSIDEVILEQTGTSVSQLASDTAVSVADLQDQLDHKVDTWFGDVVPTLLNKPAMDWILEIDKKAHNGDLYYDKVHSIAYEYIIIGTTPSWIVVTDQIKIDALYQASLRNDTLDGKRSVYYTATEPAPMASDGVTPIPIEVGDLWISSTDKVSKIYAKVSTNPDTYDWVDITNTATQNALIGLSNLEETNDGVVYTFYQRLEPTTGMSYGDWWVNVIEEHTGTVVPTLINTPASTWVTTLDKTSHLGDIYTNTVTKTKYKYIVTAEVYSWQEVIDVNNIVYATTWRYEDINGKNTTDHMTYPLAWRYKDPTTNLLAANAVNSELAKRKIAGIVSGTTQIDLSQHTNAAGWITDSSFTNWVDTVFDPLATSVAQIDNIIETHFDTVVPTTGNTPYTTWLSPDIRADHLGDIYYNTTSGIGYRFVVVGGVYSWSAISDSGVAAALEAASNAQDTADGKRRTFISGWDDVNSIWTPVLPIPPYDRGDLFTPLVDTASGADTYYKNEVYVCNVAKSTGIFANADFVPSTNAKATADAIVAIVNDVEFMQGKLDSKIETFMQPSKPHESPWELSIDHADVAEYDSYISDLWFSTGEGNKTYIYKRTATGDVIVNYGFITEAPNLPTKNNGLITDPLNSYNDLSKGIILQMPTGVNNYIYSWEETPVPTAVFDAIDGKKVIFTIAPSTYFERDIMIPTTTFVSGGITFQAMEVYISSADSTVFTASHWSKATKYTDDTTAGIAMGNAAAAQATADDAIDLLVEIASDGKLTAVEKQQVKREWDIIVGEVPKVLANAVAVGILTTDPLYTAYSKATVTQGKYELLNDYLNVTVIAPNLVPLMSSLTTTSDINSTTFRDTFKAYYNAKIDLLNAVAQRAQSTANAMTALYTSAAIPVIGTHPYLSEGDQWIPPATTGIYKINTLYTYIGGLWVASTTESADYAKEQVNITLYNSPNATTPVAASGNVLRISDLWLVTDRWYTTSTASTSSATKSTFGYLVRKYNGSIWVDITNTEAKSSALKWSAKSSKYITAPDGSITGWEMTDGSAVESTFKVRADKFMITNGSGSNVPAPFTVDTTDNTVVFNGRVSFNSVAGASDSMLSSIGVVNAYNNTVASTLSYDATEGAVKLYSSTDTTIGCAFRAIPVNTSPGETLTVTIRVRANAEYVTGLYLRVYEYNADLPNGKSYVSNDAVNSNVAVVEDTSGKTNWYENLSVTTAWKTYTYTYIPTVDAKWASVVVLNWTAIGLNPIWIKDLSVVSSTGVDLSNYVESSDIYTSGTTTINGGNITTGTITSGQIATGIALINGEVRSSDFTTVGGTGFRLKSNAAGTSADPTIYGAYIRGGVLDGTIMALASTYISNPINPSNTGRFAIDLVSNTNNEVLSVIGINNNTPTGYSPIRCVANAQKFVISLNLYSGSGGSGSISMTADIQININNTGWTSIRSKTVSWFSSYGATGFIAITHIYEISSSSFNTLDFRVSISGSYYVSGTGSYADNGNFGLIITTTNSV